MQADVAEDERGDRYPDNDQPAHQGLVRQHGG
jgi:hypothetical protein